MKARRRVCEGKTLGSDDEDQEKSGNVVTVGAGGKRVRDEK